MTTETTHSAAARLHIAYPVARALAQIVGTPVGGWPETQQAMRQADDMLPGRTRLAPLVARYLAVDERTQRWTWAQVAAEVSP